jgi:hypothetical protein
MQNQQLASAIRYQEKMSLRAPRGLAAAIERAAAQRHTGPSEWARQALLRSLEQDGVTLTPDGRIEEVRPEEGRRGA